MFYLNQYFNESHYKRIRKRNSTLSCLHITTKESGKETVHYIAYIITIKQMTIFLPYQKQCKSSRMRSILRLS